MATDGSRLAGSAIRVARLMADAGRWAPQALTVLEPLPVAVADVSLGPPALAYQQGITEGLLGAIQGQLAHGGGSDWKLAVQFGRAAPVIARCAREAHADFIVLGLGKHGKLARLAGAETAARVVRLTDVPVLAVGESVRKLPSVAVVGMDFGDSSSRAAREALTLLQPPGVLHLLHVRWAVNGQTLGDSAWERTYADGVHRGFERVLRELGTRDGIKITTEYVKGDVVETILGAAKRLNADLIAVGSHSQTVIDRLLIGSTPAQLLRVAPHSVLIAAPTGVE
ncbi:MAG TPA: universal stress protein [Gemmatimonadaceae bacterium]